MLLDRLPLLHPSPSPQPRPYVHTRLLLTLMAHCLWHRRGRLPSSWPKKRQSGSGSQMRRRKRVRKRSMHDFAGLNYRSKRESSGKPWKLRRPQRHLPLPHWPTSLLQRPTQLWLSRQPRPPLIRTTCRSPLSRQAPSSRRRPRAFTLDRSLSRATRHRLPARKANPRRSLTPSLTTAAVTRRTRLGAPSHVMILTH